MVRAMVLKELREIRGIAVLALLMYAFLLTYAIAPSLWWDFVPVARMWVTSRPSGDAVPFIEDSFTVWVSGRFSRIGHCPWVMAIAQRIDTRHLCLPAAPSRHASTGNRPEVVGRSDDLCALRGDSAVGILSVGRDSRDACRAF